MSEENRDGDDSVRIDTIRDILFGRQQKENEQRFAELERQFAAQLATLGEQAGQQVETLRARLAEDLDGLRREAEAARTEVVRDFDELRQTLEKQRAELLGSVSEQVDELRRQGVARRDLAQWLREAADRCDES